ncbi:Apolipoprotein N-acyltransferase [Oligella ureolytica]|uniref:apolipoprotein N-acyltransferase n=1 Tax=Oligella ureolytica TaxID=90244 RepID=UPI000DFBE020|nr:apolipoprotein N-acyltransferase [Oligella ureolytica]SUA52765.1 Apolipoprotein N-acyltransferase [Oligella ureolytica]
MINRIAALVLGLLHALSFYHGALPAWAHAPIQMLTFAALFILVLRAQSAKQAFLNAYLFGIASFCSSLYWLYISMHVHGHMHAVMAAIAVFLFSLYLALYYGLAALITAKFLQHLRRSDHHSSDDTYTTQFSRLSSKQYRYWLAPFIWAASMTLAELARGYVFTGFPWNAIAYAYVDTIYSAWAPIGGMYAVVFVVSLSSALLALLAFHTSRLFRVRYAIQFVCTVLLSWGLGFIQWWQPYGDPISVRLIQSNIPMSQKFDMQQGLERLYEQFLLAQLPASDPARPPAVIIFPETTIPVFQHQLSNQTWLDIIGMSTKTNATFLIGAPLYLPNNDASFRMTNSVIAINNFTELHEIINGQNLAIYNKRHLVPFGEFIPFGFQWFVDMMQVPLGSFDRGQNNQQLMKIEDQYFAPNICYEDLFGEELLAQLFPRHNNDTGASILFNISNLAWFGDTIALKQHLEISRMRALETARPMIRSTNTGSTAVINADGKVTAVLPTMQAGFLDVYVQGTQGLTWYAYVSNLPIFIFSLVILGLSWFRRPSKINTNIKKA